MCLPRARGGLSPINRARNSADVTARRRHGRVKGSRAGESAAAGRTVCTRAQGSLAPESTFQEDRKVRAELPDGLTESRVRG